MDWFNWTAALGGTGLITFLLISIFAPHLVGVVAEYLKALTPIVSKVAEGVAGFLTRLWEGFKDVVDNVSTILFVGTLVLASVWYFQPTCPSCESCVAELRKDYKFVKRTPAEKKAYQPKAEPKGVDLFDFLPF